MPLLTICLQKIRWLFILPKHFPHRALVLTISYGNRTVYSYFFFKIVSGVLVMDCVFFYKSIYAKFYSGQRCM